ncbi:MAG: OmpA family protein [Muribaculaceae bacterium]|jgi:outer membrane protein OmpA-like peptidoglycan-associated protein
MKKAILLAALALGVCTSQAQVTDAGNKFSDNWSFTLKGGGVFATKTATGEDFLKTGRGIVGAEIRKQITPTFGLGVEGEWSVNTSSWTGVKSANAFDHQYVGVFGAVNLMNLFASYTGAPRVFEIEAVAGSGWLHSYYPHSTGIDDGNSFATKVGLNFNFNLGEAKAWTISLKPALLWNMNGDVAADKFSNLGYDSHYNVNNMYFELQAGVTYHFKNSNGTHHFALVRPFDQAEIDALNAQINALRGDLEACGASNAALLAQLADLQAQLDACNRRPKEVQQVIKNLDNIRYVFFNVNSSYIQANQQPEIAMTAAQVKENAGATVLVQGYASKDGSKAFNQKLSERRAQAVKKALVQNGVPESSITTEGLGVTEVFNKLDWNRMAKMTVNVK